MYLRVKDCLTVFKYCGHTQCLTTARHGYKRMTIFEPKFWTNKNHSSGLNPFFGGSIKAFMFFSL